MKLKEYPSSLCRQISLRTRSFSTANTNNVDASILVSLTSIPSRLKVVDLTIRSLLAQSVMPHKIVLWLNEALEGEVPKRLLQLVGERFEIRFRPGTVSHRKLVYALQEFPSMTIVTCDDDLMYPSDWLSRLIASHHRYPNEVIGHECRKVAYEKGVTASYDQWKSVDFGVTHSQLCAIGYGGVLYPPGCLDARTTDEALFMRLTPKADDFWFKAMAMLKGTQVRRADNPRPKPMPIIRSQKVALGHTNVRQDGNRVQWQNLVDYFGFDISP